MELTPPVALMSAGAGKPCDPIANITKPNAAMSIPIPILRGASGSLPRLANQLKNATVIGVSSTMKYALNCWKICGVIDISAGSSE